MPFVIRDGARLYWRSDGDPASPPLLLGNSLGTEHALWAPVVPALQRRFRVLRFDWRGHGASEAPPGEYTLAMLAQMRSLSPTRPARAGSATQASRLAE
jgi:3-oxoadipate enol-lactonase/4-carboxymuconolactone decarboxylase